MNNKNIDSVIKFGLHKDPIDERDYRYSSISDLGIDGICRDSGFLKHVDHSNKMSSVKYQGALGSCVGFSICAMKEWQEHIEYEKKKKEPGYNYSRNVEEYDLSEQWVYWNAKKIDPWPGQDGTNFRSGLKVVNKIGVPVENGWPYKDCSINIGRPERWSHLIARWFLIDSYWRVEGINGLKQALIDGPVIIGIPVFEEMLDKLVSGFVPLPSYENPLGYHAVCAVGFDDSQRLVKFKNSWSPFWGTKGYGYISYEYIYRYLFDAWATRDLRVRRDMITGKFSLI